MIHLAFSSDGGVGGGANVLYALTSSLLNPQMPEEVCGRALLSRDCGGACARDTDAAPRRVLGPRLRV